VSATQENRVRRLARKHDHYITKSREWKYIPHFDNHGGYMLVNYNNCVVLGARYDATLEKIEEFLSAMAAS